MVGAYNPVWSPDGQWIAYIAVEVKDPVERYVADGLERRYEKSDSIWIIRPDGTESRQVGDRFDRIDFQIQYCEPSAGIFTIYGWSPDSQWIAYRYNSLIGPDVPSINVLTNVSTGQQLRFPGKADVHWAPLSNKVAFTSEDGQYLEILDLDKPTVSPVRISILAIDGEIPGYSTAFWSGDEKTLFLESLTGKNQSFSTPRTLWRVDLYTKDWEQIGMIESGSSVKKSPRSNHVAICVDELKHLEIRDLDTWSIIKSTSIPNDIFCDTLNWMVDRSENESISFFQPYGDKVWLYDLNRDDLNPQLIVAPTKIDTLIGSIVDLSWQPPTSP